MLCWVFFRVFCCVFGDFFFAHMEVNLREFRVKEDSHKTLKQENKKSME